MGWFFIHISDGENEHEEDEVRIQAILELNVCDRLAALLDHKNNDVVERALRIIGNLVVGTDAQTDIVTRGERMIPRIGQFLHHEKSKLQKEACWILSNLLSLKQSEMTCSKIQGSHCAFLFAPILIAHLVHLYRRIFRHWTASASDSSCTACGLAHSKRSIACDLGHDLGVS